MRTIASVDHFVGLFYGPNETGEATHLGTREYDGRTPVWNAIQGIMAWLGEDENLYLVLRQRTRKTAVPDGSKEPWEE